jgi:hypothetical protein
MIVLLVQRNEIKSPVQRGEDVGDCLPIGEMGGHHIPVPYGFEFETFGFSRIEVG